MCLTPLLAQAQTLLVVGDSISAGYGLARIDQGWVSLLQRALQPRDIVVVNASISGDTTAGGLARIDELLQRVHPRWVLIELGGNDALRGLPLDMTRTNLREMARLSASSGARVVIVGMQVPPNYGRQYAQDFQGLFSEVARAERAALVPFLLAGVADGPDAGTMFQADRIHPAAAAHPRMLDNVWKVLRPLLG